MLDHGEAGEFGRAAPSQRRPFVWTSVPLLLVWLRMWLAFHLAVLGYCGILAWFVFHAAELEMPVGTGPSGATFTDLVFPIQAFLVLVWLAGMQLAWVAALEIFAAATAPAMRPRAVRIRFRRACRPSPPWLACPARTPE